MTNITNNLVYGKYTEREFLNITLGIDMVICGFRFLMKVPKIQECTESGAIYFSHDQVQQVERVSNIGLIVGMGPRCYVSSDDRYSIENKCKVGDWVSYNPLQRRPVSYNNHECFHLNDEDILAIMDRKNAQKAFGDTHNFYVFEGMEY